MPSVLTNVDLVCLGVEYMAVTRAFNGLELLGFTPDESGRWRFFLGERLIRVISRVASQKAIKPLGDALPGPQSALAFFSSCSILAADDRDRIHCP